MCLLEVLWSTYEQYKLTQTACGNEQDSVVYENTINSLLMVFDLLPQFVCPQKSDSHTMYTAEKRWNLMIGQTNFSLKKPTQENGGKILVVPDSSAEALLQLAAEQDWL